MEELARSRRLAGWARYAERRGAWEDRDPDARGEGAAHSAARAVAGLQELHRAARADAHHRAARAVAAAVGPRCRCAARPGPEETRADASQMAYEGHVAEGQAHRGDGADRGEEPGAVPPAKQGGVFTPSAAAAWPEHRHVRKQERAVCRAGCHRAVCVPGRSSLDRSGRRRRTPRRLAESVGHSDIHARSSDQCHGVLLQQHGGVDFAADTRELTGGRPPAARAQPHSVRKPVARALLAMASLGAILETVWSVWSKKG